MLLIWPKPALVPNLPSVPFKVGSAVITPYCQIQAEHCKPVPKPQKFSLLGSLVEVSPPPMIWPNSFTLPATLFGPPSPGLLMSKNNPRSHSTACDVPSWAVSKPVTRPLLFSQVAWLNALPGGPRSVTIYRGCACALSETGAVRAASKLNAEILVDKFLIFPPHLALGKTIQQHPIGSAFGSRASPPTSNSAVRRAN